MNDLISRQAAIDAVRIGMLSTATIYGRSDEGMTARKEIERVIKELPSAQPEPQWIPCSERLPEEHTEVLTYDSSFGITFDSLHRGKWRKHPVAWMPLPEKEDERKTGKWIWKTEDKYECSCCHEIITVKEVMNIPQYITCPMCDAKMEGE